MTFAISTWRSHAVAVGVATLALLGGCAHGSGGHQPRAVPTGAKDSPVPQPPSPSPSPKAAELALPQDDKSRLAAYSFYVDPSSKANGQVQQWEAQGRTEDARQLRRVSTQPTARWLSTASTQLTRDVDGFVGRAAQERQMPVLVAYYIPHRDCGSFSAGGAASAADYRRWIQAVAAGIGNRPATVILEPDAVAQAVMGCNTDSTERYELLHDAIAVLKSVASTRVYLDAGHPSWIEDVTVLARALRRAGVDAADGFALNVANFVTTSDNVSYGRSLSEALGGIHFVIDTSRNGNGPVPESTVDGGASWCNPPGRALGHSPTSNTDLPRVDALLWIKRPGESDGACRPGEPPAGQWWPEYALGLARRSP